MNLEISATPFLIYLGFLAKRKNEPHIAHDMLPNKSEFPKQSNKKSSTSPSSYCEGFFFAKTIPTNCKNKLYHSIQGMRNEKN